jgi:predicted amidohydrolase
MRKPLSVAAVQPSCVPYDLAANALVHAAAVRAAGARLVVFPELSLTGYQLDAAWVALDDVRLTPIVDACAERDAVALVGAPIEGQGGASHIAMLEISAAGVRVAYRKLYVDGSESRFVSGTEPCALELDGFRLGLGICKDMTVQEHVLRTVELGIDAYVAGVLNLAQHESWQSARAARIAKQQQLWVVFASFAAPTGEGYDTPAGCSGVWAPDGSVRAQVGREVGGIARANLG